MDEETKEVLESLKDKKVGVFCDGSNLYHASKECGWRISFKKFKKLLENRHLYQYFF